MIVELEEPVAKALEALREQAEVRNMPLDAYLKIMVDAGGNGHQESPLSLAELDKHLDQLSLGGPLPVLPADFSRSDIYAEHD